MNGELFIYLFISLSVSVCLIRRDQLYELFGCCMSDLISEGSGYMPDRTSTMIACWVSDNMFP